MLPTYVTNLPSGDEVGTVLALDFGGSNIRVFEVILEGRGVSRLRSEKHTISDEVKTGTGQALFDFLANCIYSFVKDSPSFASSSNPIPLGFTFSFAVSQVGIDSGKLLFWNKAFSASDCVGKDVVQLLQDALNRKVHCQTHTCRLSSRSSLLSSLLAAEITHRVLIPYI
jgi:hexokinase